MFEFHIKINEPTQCYINKKANWPTIFNPISHEWKIKRADIIISNYLDEGLSLMEKLNQGWLGNSLSKSFQ